MEPLHEKGCGCRSAPGVVQHSRDLPSLEKTPVEARPKGGANQLTVPTGPEEVPKEEKSSYSPQIFFPQTAQRSSWGRRRRQLFPDNRTTKSSLLRAK